MNSLERAYSHYLRSLELSRRLGDLVYQANVHLSLSLAAELQGREAQAHEHSRQALERAASVGPPRQRPIAHPLLTPPTDPARSGRSKLSQSSDTACR
jgi:hypothetical protein